MASEVVRLHPPMADPAAPATDYAAARARVLAALLRYTLIDSYANFRAHRKSYPFGRLADLAPGAVTSSLEKAHQNPALVVLLDGVLPRPLNKHFRLRRLNTVSWGNIERFAPEIELGDFRTQHTYVDAPEFPALLTRLAPLDFALMVQRDPEATGPHARRPLKLTHMHVKVERLTDNAIRDLARQLGYVDRRLYERGDDYVEALEAKFYEYFGFPPNASGRKAAAAIAAQLLARQGMRFCVFTGSQEDCRLVTIDETDTLYHHLLVRMPSDEIAAVTARHGEKVSRYRISREGDHGVVLLAVEYRRTAAATEDMPRSRADKRLATPWLEITAERMLAPGDGAQGLPVDWVRSALSG
jgi:hypothetical protein